MTASSVIYIAFIGVYLYLFFKPILIRYDRSHYCLYSFTVCSGIIKNQARAFINQIQYYRIAYCKIE
jgi:hypothetical protein